LTIGRMALSDEMKITGPRPGYVSMCWDSNTRHTFPLGTSGEEFRSTRIIYVCYWTLHNSRPSRSVTGSGRPFPPVCLNATCGQLFEKITAVVNVKEEKFHANTPILGWCACVCCKKCVAAMPVVKGQWKACPGCRSPFAHQERYLMYPLTEEGQMYNIGLGKLSKKKRVEREMSNGSDKRKGKYG
jgi:hypothetical protein